MLDKNPFKVIQAKRKCMHGFGGKLEGMRLLARSVS
jgi:hypothetical protein